MNDGIIHKDTSNSPIGQRLTAELFRIITIEPNTTGATTSTDKQPPKTRLTLQNERFAELSAVDWNSVLEFTPGNVVTVTATINEFKGHAQLRIQSIELTDEFDPADVRWRSQRAGVEAQRRPAHHRQPSWSQQRPAAANHRGDDRSPRRLLLQPARHEARIPALKPASLPAKAR